nr:hypothetical protein [Eubacterium sp.]
MKKRFLATLLLLSLSLSVFSVQSRAEESPIATEPEDNVEATTEDVPTGYGYSYRIYDSCSKKTGYISYPFEQCTDGTCFNIGKSVFSAYIDIKIYESNESFSSGAAPIEARRDYIELDKVKIYKKIKGRTMTEATADDITIKPSDEFTPVDSGEKIYEINAKTEAKYYVEPDKYGDCVAFLIRKSEMLGYIPVSKGPDAREKYDVTVKKGKTKQWYLHYTNGLDERNLSYKNDKKGIEVYKMGINKGGDHYVSGKS